MAPHSVLLPGKSHGRRSLEGYSPWGREESDTTERLNFHFSLSCIGEGNGNPLQCSCLENPRDGGAWQAAIYGVAQSRTRLKGLSSSSSSSSSSNNYKLWTKYTHAHTHTHTHSHTHTHTHTHTHIPESSREKTKVGRHWTEVGTWKKGTAWNKVPTFYGFNLTAGCSHQPHG